MAKALRFLAVCLACGLILAGCASTDRRGGVPAAGTGDRIKVTTTIYPLYDFTRNIGGDRVEVFNLLPPGAEPHHWEPTAGDVIKISTSQVFIFCGAGLEPWAENILKNSSNGKTTVVDSSSGVKLLQEGGEQHEGGHGKESEDPHIWLDPSNAAIMVDNILSGLVKADPANRDYYTANAQSYKGRLADLDGRYRAALAGARIKYFVVSHDAFGYLAQRYGLEQLPIRGLTADAEPSPARMAEIVDLVRKHGIKHIFYETLVSPAVSKAVARETGAQTLVLNDIAGLSEEEISQGKNYLTVMEENLENLKKACEAR